MDRWPINPRRVAIFVGILVLILMVMDFNARLEDLNRLKKASRDREYASDPGDPDPNGTRNPGCLWWV